jgi:hypothetical protein
VVDPPLPEPLSRGVVFIEHHAENLQVVPVFGPKAEEVSPRIGHLHVAVDGGVGLVDASKGRAQLSTRLAITAARGTAAYVSMLGMPALAQSVGNAPVPGPTWTRGRSNVLAFQQRVYLNRAEV